MAIKPSDFGITVTGMLTHSQLTKKGTYMFSISLGNAMVKVISQESGPQFGTVYSAVCSHIDGDLYYEQRRLSESPKAS